MKQYVVIPVAYYNAGNEVYESVVRVGKPAIGSYRDAGGYKELQDYLNNGWKIHSVQTAPFSSSHNNGAIFQYILESP